MQAVQDSTCQCSALADENLTLRRQLAAAKAVITRMRNGEAAPAAVPEVSPTPKIAKVIPITSRPKKRRSKVDVSDEACWVRIRAAVPPPPLATVLRRLIQGFPGLQCPTPRCNWCLSEDIKEYSLDPLCAKCRRNVHDKSPAWTQVNNQVTSYTEAMQAVAP